MEDCSQPHQVSDHNSATSSTNPPSNYHGVPSAISTNPGYPSLASESPTSDSQNRDQKEEEEDFAHVALADHLSKLSLNTVHRRFFGPSSAFMIMKTANKIKEETLSSENLESYPFKRPQYWGIQTVSDIRHRISLLIFGHSGKERHRNATSQYICFLKTTFYGLWFPCILTKSISSSQYSMEFHSKDVLRKDCICMIKTLLQPFFWFVIQSLIRLNPDEKK